MSCLKWQTPTGTVKMNKRVVIGVAAALVAVAMLAWSATSSAHEGEHHSPGGNGQPDGAALTAMGPTPCVNGMAFTFPCSNIDLAALLPVADIDGTAEAVPNAEIVRFLEVVALVGERYIARSAAIASIFATNMRKWRRSAYFWISRLEK